MNNFATAAVSTARTYRDAAVTAATTRDDAAAIAAATTTTTTRVAATAAVTAATTRDDAAAALVTTTTPRQRKTKRTLKRKLEILDEINMKVHSQQDIINRECISKRTIYRWKAAMEQMRQIVEKEDNSSGSMKISRIDGLERVRDGLTSILDDNVKPSGENFLSPLLSFLSLLVFTIHQSHILDSVFQMILS